MRNECLKTEQKREFTQTYHCDCLNYEEDAYIFRVEVYFSFSSDMLMVERK